MPTRRLRLTVFPLIMFVVAGLCAALGAQPAAADDTTVSYTNLRTSWDANEPGLTSTSVTQPDFGKLWTANLGSSTANPNQVYAQPLVVNDAGKHLVIMATEDDNVAAFDTSDGSLVWKKNLGVPWTPYPACGDLVPHIGITSTPVYDPSSNTLYVVAKTAQSNPAKATLKMHALAITNGGERSGWPLTLGGKSTDGGIAFNASTANQRPGLMLMGNAVYFATASHCDHGPYVGFVGRVALGSNPSLKLWSAENGSASDGAGIWQSGSGPMSDGSGRIFVVTGNGVSPAAAKGSRPPGTLAESVVRLSVAQNGTMTAKDFFSPANNEDLDENDDDLGSGGPIALPTSFGSGSHRHLLVITGKGGVMYLLDRDNLGGSKQGKGGGDNVVDSATVGGVWGHAAAFDGGANAHYVYTLPSQAPLQALKVSPDAAGNPSLTLVGTSSQAFGYTSGPPIVTSQGNNPATALVWVQVCDNGSGANAMLEAFPAVPPANGAWRPVVTYHLGTIAKFTTPATDGNRIYAGTRDGRIVAFGRPTTAAITAPLLDFGLQPVSGGAVTRTLKVTATKAVVYNGSVISGSAFAAGSASIRSGTALSSGDTFTVPITFNPSSAGSANGTYTVTATDSKGNRQDYPLSVTGVGTAPGISASPGTLDFGQVAVKYGGKQSVVLQNTGTTTEHITKIGKPTGDYRFAGSVPSTSGSGYPLPAQGSVTVNVLLTPTKTGTRTGTFTVDTDASSHNHVTVHLTGVGFTGSPKLRVSKGTMDFARVAPGLSDSATFTVSNAGTARMTITKAAVPAFPFTVATPISEGQRLDPGDSITVTVAVSPVSGTQAVGSYSITANDNTGPHLVHMVVNATSWSGPLGNGFGCLTLKHLDRTNNTPIVLYPCKGNVAQTWRFATANSIRLANQNGGLKCIGVPGAATKRQTGVVIYDCNKGKSQVWKIDAAGRLVNPHSNKCLDVRNESAQSYASIVINDCDRSPTEQWDPVPLISARGLVSSGVAASYQYCLTVSSPAQGTPATINKCTFSAGQIVGHVGTALRTQGGCLQVAQGYRGSAVWLEQCDGSAAQVWQSGPNGRLYNPATRMCIDDPKGTKQAGFRLQMYTCNGSLPQAWRLPG